MVLCSIPEKHSLLALRELGGREAGALPHNASARGLGPRVRLCGVRRGRCPHLVGADGEDEVAHCGSGPGRGCVTPEEVRGREEGRKREAQRKKDVVPTRFCATSVYGRARIDMLVQVEKSERVNTRERGGRERGEGGEERGGRGEAARKDARKAREEGWRESEKKVRQWWGGKAGRPGRTGRETQRNRGRNMRREGADGAKCTGGGWRHVYDTPGAHTLEVPVIHGDLRGRFRLPLAERPCACRRTSARVHAHRVKPSRSHSDVEQGLARPSTCPPIRIE